MNTTTYDYKGYRAQLSEVHTSRGYFWEATVTGLVTQATYGPFKNETVAAAFANDLIRALAEDN